MGTLTCPQKACGSVSGRERSWDKPEPGGATARLVCPHPQQHQVQALLWYFRNTPKPRGAQHGGVELGVTCMLLATHRTPSNGCLGVADKWDLTRECGLEPGEDLLSQRGCCGSELWLLLLPCQEPVLFSTTIMENIRFGKPSASDAEVCAAAQLANADEFIRSFPEGYNTVVGESGFQLWAFFSCPALQTLWFLYGLCQGSCPGTPSVTGNNWFSLN